MEIYCGNYMNSKLKKRIPWLRYISILLLVSGTTAATPAMISYYWDGTHSEHTLHVGEAARIVLDGNVPNAMRRSAGLRTYIIAKNAIRALNEAQTFDAQVGSDAVLSLERLKKQLGCKE